MNKYLNRSMWVLIALLLTIMFCAPYIFGNISFEHDTFFHLSRIEGLAKAIANGQILPSIYFDKNDFFGYPSALFYSDFYLYPFALLYLWGLPLVITFKVVVFVYCFIGILFCIKLVKLFTNNNYIILLTAILYTFTTYRLTNVYVRSALQEYIAFAILPLVLYAIYKWLYDKQWITLGISFALLLFAHNITFILMCYAFGLIILFNIKTIIKNKLHVNLLKAILLALGLSAFYLLPMLEQMSVNSYNFMASNNANLSASSLHIYQFIINDLIFGFSGQTFKAMVTNPGFLILLLPLFGIFIIDHDDSNQAKFIHQVTIIGYLFIMLQSSAFDLSNLYIFNFMQFAWRLNNVAIILLLLGATYYFVRFTKYHNIVAIVLIIIALFNSSFLLSRAFNKDNQLSDDLLYSELLDGSIVDPYFANSSFKRIEIQAADYLAWPTINFKETPYGVYDSNMNLISNVKRDYDTLTFTLNDNYQTIILPRSYYKGYQLINTDTNQKLNTYLDSNTKLVMADVAGVPGNYQLIYQRTTVQYISYFISFIALIIASLLAIKGRKHE